MIKDALRSIGIFFSGFFIIIGIGTLLFVTSYYIVKFFDYLGFV